MPLYEYQCDKCGTVFEVRQKFSDAPLEVHPDCGGKVARLLSAPGLQFKGSGWYVTDYARASKGESKKDGGAESKSDSKPADSKPSTETKSESKPATTTTKSD